MVAAVDLSVVLPACLLVGVVIGWWLRSARDAE